MPPSEIQSDKVFLKGPYLLQYRQLKRGTWSVEPRSDYTFLFLIEGVLKGSESNELKAGSALLLNPGIAISLSVLQAEFLAVTLSPSLVMDCATRTRLVSSGAVVEFQQERFEQTERVFQTVLELVAEMTNPQPGLDAAIEALVEQLMINLLRHYAKARRSHELEVSRAGLVDRRIRRAVELMHANLDRELTVSEMASAAFLSPFHFSRLFKKLTGSTPHAYLASLRATRAQALLLETDLSITEIAARVGYISGSHFTKAFRQATGYTPREFREAGRQR